MEDVYDNVTTTRNPSRALVSSCHQFVRFPTAPERSALALHSEASPAFLPVGRRGWGADRATDGRQPIRSRKKETPCEETVYKKEGREQTREGDKYPGASSSGSALSGWTQRQPSSTASQTVRASSGSRPVPLRLCPPVRPGGSGGWVLRAW